MEKRIQIQGKPSLRYVQAQNARAFFYPERLL